MRYLILLILLTGCSIPPCKQCNKEKEKKEINEPSILLTTTTERKAEVPKAEKRFYITGDIVIVQNKEFHIWYSFKWDTRYSRKIFTEYKMLYPEDNVKEGIWYVGECEHKPYLVYEGRLQ